VEYSVTLHDLQVKWKQGNLQAGNEGKLTDSSYINEDKFLELLQNFQKRRSPGKSLLFSDGHASHSFLKFLDHCRENGIEMLCLSTDTCYVCLLTRYTCLLTRYAFLLAHYACLLTQAMLAYRHMLCLPPDTLYLPTDTCYAFLLMHYACFLTRYPCLLTRYACLLTWHTPFGPSRQNCVQTIKTYSHQEATNFMHTHLNATLTKFHFMKLSSESWNKRATVGKAIRGFERTHVFFQALHYSRRQISAISVFSASSNRLPITKH
jgi:hypothetical protein